MARPWGLIVPRGSRDGWVRHYELGYTKEDLTVRIYENCRMAMWLP